ncbi:sensor histidine kinase [Saccharicrinis fermentans]|uniref:histidine kinase n=1 Tax=Saccharicrinis fermentans DSM 9555 = JCM 21142 TaxID=869213 RepID=W7YFU3_9BACT|nr:ATP-binding protein [Saccharicrinis fermentans]GAF03321.1 non-motile and phage-resistance protein [Saccharicrinis fermentans DSM 9555 = JCM 21142]
MDITPTDEGIWFANYSQGVLFYSFETKKTRSYKHSSRDLYSISNDYVRNIISDSQGNIWIATISGLNKYVPSEDKFYRFFKKENDTNSLSNDFIYSVQEDEDGIIWIGTNGNGLNRYNPEYNKFEVLTMEDGLSGNEVYAIVLDDNGLLWISTENGITSINTVSLETRNMTSEAGIYNNKFNPSAGYKSKSGELFFGGSNGFIRFSPFMIRTNPVAPIAIISHFSINNREVMPNTIGSVLKDHISNTREIRLHHRQNSFSFDFVASNYLFPSKNKFRYRLLGFDEEWLETDFVGKAIYTNISPGKYVFEVLAANNDEVWNHEPTSLAIVVSPPLWKRWYAFLFYLITIVVLAYLIRVEIISKEKLKNEVTIEKIHLENEKKLSQLKLQFFTNISHEFRTPLTLILGPVERLLKSYAGEDQVADQLTIVRNNALRLLKLVTQIIDFRKVETGKMELEMVDVNIVDLCSDIYNSFKEHARYRNITFSMDVDMSQISIKIDKDKFDKILFNLLSNAFKNTPDNGVIKLVMRKNAVYGKDMFKDSFVIGKMFKGDYLEVSVHDNGCGIARDDLSRIFDRFYHGKEGKYANVGIGLSLTKELVNMMQGRLEVYTEEKKGSVFAVQFAIDSNVRFDHQTLLSEMSNGWDKGGAPAEWESVDLNGNIKHKDAWY